MNNELFDRMMKDSLNKVSVTPSQGLKKSLGRKLFFQNLLNFHKVKVVVAILFMGTAGVLSYNYIGSNTSEVLSTKEYQASNETIDRLEILNVEVIESINNSNISNDTDSGTEVNTPQVSKEGLNETVEETANNSNDYNTIVSNDNADNGVKKNNDLASYNSKDDQKEVDLKSNEVDAKADVYEEQSPKVFTLEAEKIEQSDLGLSFADARIIDMNTDYLNTPVPVKEEDISFKNKPLIRKELSIDIHKSLMATNDVDNSLKSAAHQEFHWDFYKENDDLKTSNLGGIDVNYAVGTKTIKGKASIGFNASQVIEQKPTYEFDEITDPVWLEVFEVDELAWVNTYGEDTCTQCFSTHNTAELQDELENENNTYKYVSVPLRLGAELNLKYVSLDVMGGIQLNHLTSASGIYVKNKTPDTRKLYYWDDMEVSTLNKDNDMLKRNYLSWTASANFRIRLSRQFDLLAGYDMVFSKGNITHDKYIMDKSLQYAQAKVGITFYPNRVPLLKK